MGSDPFLSSFLSSRRFRYIIVGLVVIAAVLRALGMFDDFWLDEIWSYNIARQVHNPLDILFSAEARFDNNHPLNTLFLFLLGVQPHWPIYRVMSLAAGIGSVIVIAIIARRRGTPQALLATTMAAFSYPLIYYSSEARGYAPAVFFALLGFDAVERYLIRPSWKTASVFAGACVLGLLSHLTFFHFYAGVFAWTGYRLLRSRRGADLVRLHAIPLIFTACLYLVFVRHLVIGGSPQPEIGSAIIDAIAQLLGISGSLQVQLLVAIAATGMLVWIAVELGRRGSDLWVFLVVAAVVSPVLILGRQVLTLTQHQPIAPRYFLIVLPFFLLFLAVASARFFESKKARPVILLLAAIFIGINLRQTVPFFENGRGHYSDAVIYMSNNSPPGAITVLSDHSWRTTMVLNYYAQFLPASQTMTIYGADDPAMTYAAGAPMWIVIHNAAVGVPPARQFTDPRSGRKYVFDREFDYYGFSGFCWYLYRGLPI